MDFLVYNGNDVFFEAGTIEKGHFDVDPNTELYKVTNDKGVFYATVQGFTQHYVEDIPEEVASNGKWCYTQEKGFFENLDWQQSPEERITSLEKENKILRARVDYIAMMSDVEL